MVHGRQPHQSAGRWLAWLQLDLAPTHLAVRGPAEMKLEPGQRRPDGRSVRAGQDRPAIARAVRARERVFGRFNLFSAAVEPDNAREHGSLGACDVLGLVFCCELVKASGLDGQAAQPASVDGRIAPAGLHQDVGAEEASAPACSTPKVGAISGRGDSEYQPSGGSGCWPSLENASTINKQSVLVTI